MDAPAPNQPRSSFHRAGLVATCLLACILLVGLGSLRADEPAVRLAEGAVPSENALTASGKLFICGGGKLPHELRQRFINLAGGTQARIVVITTASPCADTDRMESKLALWREQTLADLTILHTRSRVTADEPQFVSPLTLATGVWFVGGDQNWLIDTYLGIGVDRSVLASKVVGTDGQRNKARVNALERWLLRREVRPLSRRLGYEW